MNAALNRVAILHRSLGASISDSKTGFGDCESIVSTATAYKSSGGSAGAQ
jgi:hypothetical protein